MQDPREAVGPNHSDRDARAAQKKAWQAIQNLAADLKSGASEAETKKRLTDLLKNLGSSKNWHPPQIRFGCNTTQPFGKPSQPNVLLQENDLFFLDIGPVFCINDVEYEADVGQTFVLGSDSEMQALARDSEIIFNEVKERWSLGKLSGLPLYEFAKERARLRGWRLSLEGASGHRIGDFPHSVYHRGKLKSFDEPPTPNRWILEIHIFHPEREIAAFFEDVL
jgi:Xaa-Pro aminopeptidase